MKTCDLGTSLALITHAFTQLKERWNEARQVWHDDAARQFEETHLRPLPDQIQRLFVAAHRLSDILAKAEKELNDEAP